MAPLKLLMGVGVVSTILQVGTDTNPQFVFLSQSVGSQDMILDSNPIQGMAGAAAPAPLYPAWTFGVLPSMVTAEHTLVAGEEFFVRIAVTIPTTSTGVAYVQTTQGNYTATGFNGFGLYQWDDPAQVFHLIRQTTDDGTMWKNAGGMFQKAWTETINLDPGEFYVIGMLFNASPITVNPKIGASPTCIRYDVDNAGYTIRPNFMAVNIGAALAGDFSIYTGDARRPFLLIY